MVTLYYLELYRLQKVLPGLVSAQAAKSGCEDTTTAFCPNWYINAFIIISLAIEAD